MARLPGQQCPGAGRPLIRRYRARMSTPVTPPRTFPELLAARLQGDPGQPLRHGVRRHHRRTHRAVGHDLRQLGQQDREPVHRRARARRRRHGAPRPAGALAGPGVPRRGLELGAVRHHRRRRARTTSWSADRTRSTGTATPTRSSPARCCPFAVRFRRRRCRPGVLDYGVLWPGQSDVFVPARPADAGHPGLARHPTTPAPRPSCSRRPRRPATQPGVRLLTDVHPAADHGVPAFLGPLRQRWLAGAAARPAGTDVARSSRGRAGRRTAAGVRVQPTRSV